MSEKDDPLKYVREIQKLMKEEEIPDFTRKEEPFLSKRDIDIFHAHPDAVKGILYKVYEKK